MNYLKPKMDNKNNLVFIIVLSFILLGLFVIVPIVMILYSNNLRLFYMYGGLSESNIIMIVYCVVVIIAAIVFLILLYKNQKNQTTTQLTDTIKTEVSKLTLSKQEIESLIDTKLKDKTTRIIIEQLPNHLHNNDAQVVQNPPADTTPTDTAPTDTTPTGN